MKCPHCEDGVRGVPLHIMWAEGKQPKTPEAMRDALAALAKCDFCDGTGEITEQQSAWLETGKKMRQRRLDLGYGLRQAAERLGLIPSDYSGMESGRVPPDPKVLDRLPPVDATST